jgi:hypothetical protein
MKRNKRLQMLSRQIRNTVECTSCGALRGDRCFSRKAYRRRHRKPQPPARTWRCCKRRHADFNAADVIERLAGLGS